jgi:hypothetical protein
MSLSRQHDNHLIRRLDAISRTRALTMRESVTLELAINRVRNRERMRERYRSDEEHRQRQIEKGKRRWREMKAAEVRA